MRDKSNKRIELIDVLRGFALVGILYAHMVIWYTGASLPEEVYFKYHNTIDLLAMAVFGTFVFGKFFSVFSFLFGLSFFLYFRKNKTKLNHLPIYLWRLFLLFLIGIVHHTFWRGDILAVYAVLGMFLLLFWRLPKKLILVLAILLITNIPTHLYEFFKAEIPYAEINFPMASEAEKYYNLVQNGNFLTVLKENWASWPAKIKYQIQSGRLPMSFGYFLLGFYAGRINIFTSINRHLAKLKKWNGINAKAILFLLLVGFLMYLMNYVSLPELNIVPKYKWLASFFFGIYNVCVTIFFITGICILYQNSFYKPFLKPLAAMGKMALTNYLLQTVFGLLLFYQFGFDLFDKTSPAVNILLAAGVFYLQLKFSQYWLKIFKQGPVEWLWKTLTYFPFPKRKKKLINPKTTETTTV